MEIQRIAIDKEGRQLLSVFMGEDPGNTIDFNWLMPVVEKIETIDNGGYGFTIDFWGMVIIEYKSSNEEEIVEFQNDDHYPKIVQYYSCVVDFIKRYNSKS